MSEHLLTDDIKNYINRQMTPAELLKADDHLAGCDLCFQQINDLQFARRAADLDFLNASPDESEHLSYEQLENYVDEKSDIVGREIADVHLQICGTCKQELDDLFEMRKLIEDDAKSQMFVPQKADKSASNPIWDFLSGRYFLRFGFAALAVLLVVSLVGVYWFLKREKSNEIAVTSSPSNINPQENNQNREENLPTNIQPNANTNALRNTNSETNLPKPVPNPNEIESLPPQYQAEIERVLANGNLNIPPEIKQLNDQAGKLMSGGTETIPFALSSPLGKIIQTNRPRFQWRTLEGASGYIVNVYDDNFNQVAVSPQLSTTNWQVDKPLIRNKIYLWQVTAIKDGEEIKSPTRPAPDAKFKVLDAKKANELIRLSSQYKNEHLFLGIMFAKAGLLDEARREFQKEIAKNPKSEIARKLLQNVRTR